VSSHRPSKFRLLAAAIGRLTPRIVAVNLTAAVAIWWLDWPPLFWLAGAMAVATTVAAAVTALDYWTSPLPWRSLEQRGLKRKRQWLFRSIRYHVVDETVTERTLPLGCATFLVVVVTGFVTTAAGWLGIATMVFLTGWGTVLQENEQWPPVEPVNSSDPD